MTAASINTIVVLHAFGPYSRGQMLTDPTIISAIMSGGHASMVVPTQVPQHGSAAATTEQEH